MSESKRHIRTDAEIIYSKLGREDFNADHDIEIIADALNLTRNMALNSACLALDDVKYVDGDPDPHAQMWNASVKVLQKKILSLKWRKAAGK